ncbi:MAG: alpha/beta hydrolase [Patescibacteria group bacterium]
MPEKVNFKTADGINIAASHWRGKEGSPAVLLLHMMPATKESWNEFAQKLNQAGFGVLAIDLRGHGQSEGGPDGWRSFSDSQHQKSIEDARVGFQFQKDEGHSKFFLAGASIGANLALQFLAESDETSAAVLLSPGLNYRGIETLEPAVKIRPNQGVFFAAAGDDRVIGADSMARKLYDAANCKKDIKIFEKGGHGTDLFAAHPELMPEIIDWFKKFL